MQRKMQCPNNKVLSTSTTFLTLCMTFKKNVDDVMVIVKL